MKKQKWQQIKWTAKATYIDNETGEIINKKQIENGTYIEIHTDIKKQIQQHQPKGTIEYIHKCERSKQQRLFE